jgi:hypothetical protein
MKFGVNLVIVESLSSFWIIIVATLEIWKWGVTFEILDLPLELWS